MSNTLATLCLVLAICAPATLIAACDSIAPIESTEEIEVYFPARIGNTWTYEYLKKSKDFTNGNAELTQGTLIWTVTDSTMLGGQIDLEVHEVFEGRRISVRGWDGSTTEDTLTWNGTFSITLSEQVLRLSRYTESLPEVWWLYPSATPDTVVVDTLLSGEFGSVTKKKMTLVRQVGLTYWRGGTEGRGENYEELRLQEKSVDI